MRSGRAGRAGNFFRFGLVFIVVLFFFELFLRWSGSSRPSEMVTDDTLGLAYKPKTDIIALKEGFRLGRINEYGYYGPAYLPEKPKGVIRIALVGDSFVLGRYLFDRHHFRRILEDELNKRTQATVQVFNFGFTAANFERMFLYYELFGAKFSPDYVLYFVSTNSLNRTDMAIGPRVKVRDDSLSIDYSFRTSEEFQSMKRWSELRELGLYSLLRKCAGRFEGPGAPRVLLSTFFGRFASIYYALFWPRPDLGDDDAKKVEAHESKEVNRAIVREIAAMNERGPTKYIIVCRDDLPESFVRYVRENGITYFDPSDELDELVRSGIDPHYWKGSQTTGHWNQYAHRVVGDFLIEKMAPLLEGR